MTRNKLAAIQMTSVADVAENLRQARVHLQAAAREGAGLAVLPENFAYMAIDDKARAAVSEPEGRGPIQEFLAAAARECGLWIVGGTIPLKSRESERPYAACCVWDDQGRRVGRYDKIHLFDVRVPDSTEAYSESRRTMPGSAPLVLPTPFGQLGIAVCYDLRFPELFRSMLDRDANVIALPAAFTEPTGEAHWHTLIKARAIENLCYVAAAAQTGEHPGGRRTYGHSMIVGPWGEVLAEASGGPGVAAATLDLDYLQRLRSQFPVLSHRRLPGPVRSRRGTPRELMTTPNSVGIARRSLLAPTGIEDRDLDRALNALLQGGVDAADLYFQVSRHEAWSLEDGIVKEGSHSIEQGVGVRAMAGDKTGFAYSDEIVMPALMHASHAAGAIARSGQHGALQAWSVRDGHHLYPAVDPIPSLSDDDKVALLQRVDAATRAVDPRVKQVMASLMAAHEVILVCSSDGVLAADVRPLVRMNVSVIVEDQGRREQGYSGGGGRVSYEHFVEGDRAFEYGREAVRQALVALEAVPAPAGEMVVVLGPGWPGVLLHEAIGHGLEGDFNRKGTSAFSKRLGEKVASDLCTIVDDGTIALRRGSLNVDDEGTPTQRTVLIENGRLAGYIQDKLNARLMGMQPTGNGRRQSFAHMPMPRMTNTYMLPGPHTHEEIIASVSKGIYARNFGGGQVDITSGKFVFSASEAYLIDNGRLGAPIRDATLIGDGPSVLRKVSMVGNDLQLDDGVGTCGKEGQSVPVGVGQPTLRIDGLTVGGTAGAE